MKSQSAAGLAFLISIKEGAGLSDGQGVLPDKMFAGKIVPPARQTCPYVLRANTIRVFIIVRPTQRIGFDVTGNPVHFGFVADDVFVIISLPDNLTFGITQQIDLFG